MSDPASAGKAALVLAGRKILVTRARSQAGRLADELRALGADVAEIPAIEIVPPQSYAELDQALQQLHSFHWLILTSSNGVAAVRARMAALDVAAPAGLQIAAVGSATAQALRAMGLEPTVTPREYVAESLVEVLGERVRGQRVLLARAAVARDVIPEALRQRGAEVEVVDAYRTVIPPDSVEKLQALFAEDGKVPDAATFTSSSTVTNFLALAEAAGCHVPKGMHAVSIGPITSRTLRENGREPAAEADPHDLAGLVEAVVQVLS